MRIVDRPPPQAPVGPVARWFLGYFRRLAARSFAGVHWTSAEDPAQWDRTPLLLVANHSTWWDGPLAYLLSAQLQRPFQVAMEARYLERHPYFRWIGAHPLRREGARTRFADLEWLGQALTPGSLLWIFPQGKRRPAASPLRDLERGAAHLALQRAPVRIVPVGIRLAHLSEQLPDAFVRIGPTWLVRPDDPRDRRALTEEIATSLRGLLDGMDAQIQAEWIRGWRPLAPETLSVNKRFERLVRKIGLGAGEWIPRNE
jgi:1-acyl-sn-glycerol-3-phosphate acyltransferase